MTYAVFWMIVIGGASALWAMFFYSLSDWGYAVKRNEKVGDYGAWIFLITLAAYCLMRVYSYIFH